MNKLVILVVIVVLAGIGGVLALTKKSSAPSSSENSSTQEQSPAPSQEQPTNNSEAANAGETATITYTNNGFSPANLSVKAGTKITVKNDSSSTLQFDSDPHPQHTDNPELNAGNIDSGESKTFTVTKTGSHGFHNHLRSSDTGILTVE